MISSTRHFKTTRSSAKNNFKIRSTTANSQAEDWNMRTEYCTSWKNQGRPSLGNSDEQWYPRDCVRLSLRHIIRPRWQVTSDTTRRTTELWQGFGGPTWQRKYAKQSSVVDIATQPTPPVIRTKKSSKQSQRKNHSIFAAWTFGFQVGKEKIETIVMCIN